MKNEASSDNLVAIREQKGENWKKYGFEPYGKFVSHNVRNIFELKQNFVPDEQVTDIVGRIRAIRGQGGVRFIDLEQDHVLMQLLVSKRDATEQTWSLFQLFDIGDIISVGGKTTVTPAGEKTIKVNDVIPITKCLVPPSKNGAATVEDPETKYRQRYRDLIENSQSMAVFKTRSRMISSLRRFFEEEEGAMEVETPNLCTLRSGANAKAFETHHNALGKNMFLRVAPELYLKRLVVGGMHSVFEVGKNFRNEGLSTRHNPEFTSVEFYRACVDYNHMIDCVKRLFNHLKGYAYSDLSYDLFNFVEVRMIDCVREALLKYYEYDLLDITDIEVVKGEMSKRGIVLKANTAGSLLYELYEIAAEPNLVNLYKGEDGRSVSVFVKDYPIEVSPLAKTFPANQQYLQGVTLTERFELFIDGKEVANAFTELNDPKDQAQRFQEQLNNRSAGDQEAMDYDHDYIHALQMGLISCAGLGIGIDRLVMLFTQQKSIRDVVLFPAMR